MLAAWMVSCPVDLVKSVPSMTALPSNWLNAPRTLVTIAWRATNPIRVWAGSMTYVPDSSDKVAGMVLAAIGCS
jgi:hypothetical protein